MCDYCGCRDLVPIDDLAREHERLLDLGYRLRRLAREGSHAAVMVMLEQEFMPLLDQHTSREERGLFTQLRARWEADDRLDALVGEHRSMEAQLLGVLTGDPGWAADLEKFVADLAEHVLAEETDLFPYAMYELDAHQWRAVQAAHGGGAALAG